ncbi:MAG: type 1 glutamine amidotransferase [Proteobacteria bacterium]|nr:type 1 glutamine amidotransferase [Pseudomonadota bacterium]
MTDPHNYLIIDGYPKESRDELEQAGMSLAWKLYVDMLLLHQPEASYHVLLPSDPGVQVPSVDELKKYEGIIWTGCNLSISDTSNPSVSNQIELARRAYEAGVPSFGSCWALQVAVVAAGGEVKPNPKGRGMGMGRKIYLRPEAFNHPMFKGKPRVFEAFVSHEDIVTKMPPNSTVLASNSFAEVQAAEITHKNGTFWSVQYHPEYNLHEMARLIVAREEMLIAGGFFQNHDDLITLVSRMETLFENPDQKDLRWQMAIDDDVLKESIRYCEFVNWLNNLVLPGTTRK